MIWLTWRQHRWEMVITAALVAAVAIVFVVQGLRAASLAVELGIPTRCVPACGDAFMQFDREFDRVRPGSLLFILLPLLAAPFLGAPLVAREHEFRTSLLVWAQGVTRARWLATKLLLFSAVLATAALVLAAVGPLAANVWSTRALKWYENFDWSAPVLVSSALFALALGVFAGVLTRRILGAMVLALMLVAVARAGVTAQLRPNYLPPLVATSRQDIPRDSWIVSSAYVDAAGETVPIERLIEWNMKFFASGSQRLYPNSDDYLAEHGIFFRATYHPTERSGTFQLIEGALYLGLALGLFAASLWLTRRRPA